jgi:hypothetical protein
MAPVRRAVSAALLGTTERILQRYTQADFDANLRDPFPECIEYVRQVEITEAWKIRYGSIEEFYVAHQARNPDIRVYGAVRLEIKTADPLTDPGGSPSQRIARAVVHHAGGKNPTDLR